VRDDTGGTKLVCLPLEAKVVPTPEAECVAFIDITDQVIESISLALQSKGDPWRAIRVMASAEQIMDLYASHRFISFLPLQRQLQATLHSVWRMTRRRFIRAALRAPDHEYELYQRDFKSGIFDGEDALEDWHAVERHLDEGRALFDDLHRRGKLKIVG
jgi:hypothetical protein